MLYWFQKTRPEKKLLRKPDQTFCTPYYLIFFLLVSGSPMYFVSKYAADRCFSEPVEQMVFWQMLKQCCGKSISYEVGFVILFHQSLRNEQQQSRAAVLQMALTHIHPFHTAYIFQKSLGLHLPS